MQAVAIDVAQVITTHYAHQGGLANISLVLGTTDIAVKYLTDDPRLQQEYYKDVVYELDKFIMPQQRSWAHTQTPIPETTMTNDKEMQPPSAPPPSSSSAEASIARATPSTTRATRSKKAAKKNVCKHCGAPLSRNDAVQRHWDEACTFNPKSKKKKKSPQQHVIHLGNHQY